MIQKHPLKYLQYILAHIHNKNVLHLPLIWGSRLARLWEHKTDLECDSVDVIQPGRQQYVCRIKGLQQVWATILMQIAFAIYNAGHKFFMHLIHHSSIRLCAATEKKWIANEMFYYIHEFWGKAGAKCRLA